MSQPVDENNSVETNQNHEQDSDMEEAAPTPVAPTPRELAKSELEKQIDYILPDAPSIDQLPFSLVNRHDKRTVQLLANSGSDRPVSGKRIWFKYEFTEVSFIEMLIIKLEDYNSYSDFEISYTLFDGSKRDEMLAPHKNEIRLTLNQFIKDISFRPPRRQGYSAKVHEVILYGFPKSEAAKFGNYADNLETERRKIRKELDLKYAEVLNSLAKLIKLQQEREEISHQISSGRKSINAQSNELEKLNARREELVSREESLNQSIRNNDQEIADQKNRIGEISDVRSKLARSIIAKEQKLKALTANINLFPSELSDFVSQGSRDVKLYAGLAMIPIIVIAGMFGILIEGGVDLTTKITGEDEVNILAILVSRMPFVIVAVTVVTACYYLARMFILEMVRVNRQKLSLSKIGIIAKDISYSTENELGFDDDEKYSRRLRLKMDMLRDHLKDYLSKDFEPSLPEKSPFEQMSLPGLRGREADKADNADDPENESEFVDSDDDDSEEEER
ncbi:MAG: hypothetical protein MK010_00825 [Erythrobacter sp.]|nr:hypothetical protein [Erythrobacter sp.]